MSILTYCHHLHRANHQAVIHLAFDPLFKRLIPLCVFGHVHQQLSKCEATNGEGMDHQGAGDKAVSVEQLQQPFSMI